MRQIIAAIALVACLSGIAPAPSVVADAAVVALSAQEVEIQIGEDPWYEQPVWIAIAVIGAIVVIALILMAVRGRGSRV